MFMFHSELLSILPLLNPILSHPKRNTPAVAASGFGLSWSHICGTSVRTIRCLRRREVTMRERWALIWKWTLWKNRGASRNPTNFLGEKRSFGYKKKEPAQDPWPLCSSVDLRQCARDMKFTSVECQKEDSSCLSFVTLTLVFSHDSPKWWFSTV